jgi:hypothetical protein
MIGKMKKKRYDRKVVNKGINELKINEIQIRGVNFDER